MTLLRAQAFVVGLCTFGASYIAGALLILFYYSSSKLTKVGATKKQKIDAEYSEGGQRSYVQVSGVTDLNKQKAQAGSSHLASANIGSRLFGSGNCDCSVHLFQIWSEHSVTDRFS